jgi:hypothetical protein
MDHELEFVVTNRDEKEVAFEGVVPEGASDVRHLPLTETMSVRSPQTL